MNTDEAIIKIYSYVKDLVEFQLLQAICVIVITLVVLSWAISTCSSWHKGE